MKVSSYIMRQVILYFCFIRIPENVYMVNIWESIKCHICKKIKMMGKRNYILKFNNTYIKSLFLAFWISASQSVQSLSHIRLFVTPWTAACQASLSITNSQSLFKLTSIELVMPSNHLILCHLLLLLPSIFPSIRVFSNESVLCIRWPNWSFSFSISPSNEYSWFISIRMDWLDLLAVQGTLKSSPIPHFKSINSLALSFLYSPTLKSFKYNLYQFIPSNVCIPFDCLFSSRLNYSPSGEVWWDWTLTPDNFHLCLKCIKIKMRPIYLITKITVFVPCSFLQNEAKIQ